MDNSLLPNVYDFISHTYPFSLLSTLEQDTLAASVKITYYTPNDVLVDDTLSGVGLFMIRTGAVEQINKDGTLRARLGTGDSFGYTQLNKKGSSDYKVCFLENTLIYLISRQILEFIKSRNEQVGRYFDDKEYVRLMSSHRYLEEGDGYLNSQLKQPVGAVCSHDCAMLPPETSIQDTARALRDQNSEIAMIMRDGKLLGVVTKSDLALRAVADGLSYTNPVSSIMTTHPVVIDSSKPLYQVLELMLFHNIQNLPVANGDKIEGCVNTRELLQNSLLQALYLLKAIGKQQSLEELVKLSSQKEQIFITLVQLKVQPRTIQRVLSRIADSFIKQICKLADEKFDKAPCAFAFFAAGSLARSEVQFLSDQDNGIIYEREITESERHYFQEYAHFVCKALDSCGYTWCSGNYMACNDTWCQSFDKWREVYNQWMAGPDPKALLDISVFLDIRCVYGDEFLVTKLKQHYINAAADNSRFLAMLTHNSLAVNPPLGMFKQFVLTKDGQNRPALNIKNQGVNLIIELARIYALQKRSMAVNTYQRLEDSTLDKDSARELSEAFTFLNDVRFAHQQKALQTGSELTNFLPPQELSQFERNHLKDAFRIISRQQSAASFRFMKEGLAG